MARHKSWFCPIACLARAATGGRAGDCYAAPTTYGSPDHQLSALAGLCPNREMRICVGAKGFGASAAPKLERGMAHDGKTQREAAERARWAPAPDERDGACDAAAEGLADAGGRLRRRHVPRVISAHSSPADRRATATERGSRRRPASRQAARPAGPARPQVAANDDAPSIGGLIFSLQQQPSNRPFAAGGGRQSGSWLVVGAMLAWAMLSSAGPGVLTAR